jgi:exodeoxyribonuclease V gamma subunit
MHQHAHPLLAAWGRQGRDFMRALDAFDDAEAAGRRFALPGGELPRIDLFDHEQDAAADHHHHHHHAPSLLLQVQRAIRDLVPLAEHPRAVVPLADRSIVFHIAHSAQREVEILHDQLLHLLAHAPGAADAGGSRPGRALEPRDIVVMMPDVEVFAPAIRAVFGQYGREDARFIPYEIADLRQRGHNPLVLAMEWLLRAPAQRFGLAELKNLLDVPALARRLGLDGADLPRLGAWMEGAGIRWGLHAAQREGLGLHACGEQNSALFGLRRMLLGYAAGSAAGAFTADLGEGDADPIWPYDEIGGLEAEGVGALADLVERLSHWWEQAGQPATPALWVERGRALLDALFEPGDERERLTLAGLRSALDGWLDACDTAGFEAEVPVEVLREAWLDGMDSPGSGRRFLAGGVTFCTLMPLRSVPFEVVCLLGMNDGDYPRATRRSDFDLLGLPGQARPGDRSRRDDDRYLMLEALLSARRVLYIGWSGRSLRDNSEQPPSVLVAQLRDYLGAGWRAADPPPEEPVDAPATPKSAQRLLHQLSTEHPLQPFSRRYFEAGALLTYAREWRAAHDPHDPHDDGGQADLGTGGTASAGPQGVDLTGLPRFETHEVPVTVAQLVRFLKNPVKEFFRVRLHVIHPGDGELSDDDDEVFTLGGLADWQLLDELTADPQGQALAASPDTVAHLVQARLARVTGSGRLPMAGPGRRAAEELQRSAEPMLAQWLELQAAYPQAAPPQALTFEHAGLRLQDWSDGLRCGASDDEPVVWISSTASRIMTRPDKKTGARSPRPDKLPDLWVRLLASAASGHPATQAILLGRDACLQLAPLPRGQAATHLAELLAVWQAGMQQPLPLPCRTGLSAAADLNAQATYEGSPHNGLPGECEEACLARTFPDFDALIGQPGPLAMNLDAALAATGSQVDGVDDDTARLARSLFLDLAQRIYTPLLQWAQAHHTLRPWAGADDNSLDDTDVDIDLGTGGND